MKVYSTVITVMQWKRTWKRRISKRYEFLYKLCWHKLTFGNIFGKISANLCALILQSIKWRHCGVLCEYNESHSDQNLEYSIRMLSMNLWHMAWWIKDTLCSQRVVEPSCASYCSSRTLLLVKPLIKKQYLRDNKFLVITMGTTNDLIRVEKL